MRRLIKNTALNALGSVFDRGGIVVLTAMLSGALTADDFRDFGQFQLTLTMLASFASVGLTVSVSRIFAERDGGRSDQFSLVGTMWLLSLIASALLGGAAVALNHAGAPIDVGVPPSVVLAGLIALTLGLVAGGGVLGLGLFSQGAMVSMGTAAVLLGVGAWAAAERSLALAAAALVWAYAVNGFLSSALVLKRVSWREMFRKRPLAPDALRQVGGLVGPLALVTLLAASANWLLGQLLLHRAPQATEAFAGFIIGLQWFALVQFLPGLVGRALFPDLVKGGDAQISGLRQGLRMSLMLAIGVAAGIWILAPLVSKIYDRSAVGEGWVISAFALAAMPQSVANLVGSVLVARRLQSAWALLSLGSYIILILLAYFLAPCGAIGIAAALAVSGATLAAGAVVVARRRRLL